MNRPTADQLNAYLTASEDNIVQVTTYNRSVVYEHKHAGWFEERGGNLHVRRGRGRDCLSNANGLLVAIRTGSYK